MIQSEFKNDPVKDNSLKENVCDLNYLIDMMGGKKILIKEIIDVFLQQVPEELEAIHQAILKTDYTGIKNYAHTMKSSVSIMGISTLRPVLQEMENLGTEKGSLNRIMELNEELKLICKKAIEEVELEKHKYL